MACIITEKEMSKMSAKKRYDAACKEEIAQVYLDGQHTAPSLEMGLGLHVNTTYKGAELYKTNPENGFPGSEDMRPGEAGLVKAKRRIMR
jgi:transposase-like protein